MIDWELASLALGSGLVAAFNPCGFAMLPAYLSYFLGLESDDETNTGSNILRGLVVGLTLTAGFVLLFTVIGVLTSTVISSGTIQTSASAAETFRPWIASTLFPATTLSSAEVKLIASVVRGTPAGKAAVAVESNVGVAGALRRATSCPLR